MNERCWAGRWSEKGECGEPTQSPTGLCPECERRLEGLAGAIRFVKGPS